MKSWKTVMLACVFAFAAGLPIAGSANGAMRSDPCAVCNYLYSECLAAGGGFGCYRDYLYCMRQSGCEIP